MSSTLDILIKTYGEHGANPVEADGQILLNAFGIHSFQELIKIKNFPDLKELVKKIQEDIEWETRDTTTSAQKIIQSLKLVLDYAEDRAYLEITSDSDYEFKMGVVEDLLRENFKKWEITDENLLIHFSFLFPKLKDWNFYFISYTSKGAYELNRAYHDLFQQFDTTLDASDVIMRKANIFSKLIHGYLLKENIRKGFYDKENIRVGDDFQEEIVQALTHSFVFIQVITRSALWNIIPNWPYKEYQLFLEAHNNIINQYPAYEEGLKRRFRFIKCSENGLNVHPGGGIPRQFRHWEHHFEKLHYKMITPNLSKAELDEVMYDLCISVKNFIVDDLISKIPIG